MAEENANLRHGVWDNAACMIEILKQLPHRDGMRLERVSSSFKNCSRRGFKDQERVALDFSAISGKYCNLLDSFHAVWHRYRDKGSRVTALTIPITIGKQGWRVAAGKPPRWVWGFQKIFLYPHDDSILLRLGNCYERIGPELCPPAQHKAVALRTLRFKHFLETAVDLRDFKRILKNVPQLKVLEFGAPNVLFKNDHSYCGYADIADFFEDIQLPTLQELHISPWMNADALPGLSGPSFENWTPNLKVLNAFGFKKSNQSIDPATGKCSFELMANCPLEELRLADVSKIPVFDVLAQWTKRQSTMLRTLTILHLDNLVFPWRKLRLLAAFENLVELKCFSITISKQDNIREHRSEMNRIRRLEICNDLDMKALEFVCCHCSNLAQFRLISLIPAPVDEKLQRLNESWNNRDKGLEVFIGSRYIDSTGFERDSYPNISIAPYQSLHAWGEAI